MSDTAIAFLIDSLAASGLAILNGNVAAELRADLWRASYMASGELTSPRTLTALKSMPGVQQYRASLAGIEGEVLIAARSPVRLAERVEEITGRSCTLLVDGPDSRRARAAAGWRPAEEKPTPAGDLYAHVATVSTPRRCLDCKRLDGAARRCGAADASGLLHPDIEAPRRCPAFRTIHVTTKTTGLEIWPELRGATPSRPAAVSSS